MKNPAAVALRAIKSDKRSEASRENGRKGGRPVNCRNCSHTISIHEWSRSKTRGKCTGCDCSGFVPANGKQRPENKLIGKLRNV
jgi:hypothetical protein